MLIPDKLQLTGTDYFQLLLDKHMRKHGQIGNVVRLQLNLKNKLGEESVRHAIHSNEILKQIASLKLGHGIFRIPKWETRDQSDISFEVHHNLSENEFERKILNQDIVIGSDNLFRFDLVYFANGGSSLILSAHHVVSDQRGMMLLMRSLDKTLNGDATPDIRKLSFLKMLADTIYASIFLMKSPPIPLAKLSDKKIRKVSPVRFRIIKFLSDETNLIDQSAATHGAGLVKSAFFMAATLLSLNEIVQSRGGKKNIYWIPVPLDQRLRGEQGGILGNRQSFLFFRISSDQITGIRELTGLIASQMKHQVKEKIPSRYSNLMNFFRRMPLSIYLKMVNLPTWGSVSSFTFSDLGEAGGGFKSFMDVEVEDVLNYPSVPYPPGLTIVFSRFKGSLSVLVGFVEEALRSEEVDKLETHLRLYLLNGNA